MSILNSNTIQEAQNLVDSLNGNVTVKRIKKDNSLLERSDNSDKIILAEDNRQVLFG